MKVFVTGATGLIYLSYFLCNLGVLVARLRGWPRRPSGWSGSSGPVDGWHSPTRTRMARTGAIRTHSMAIRVFPAPLSPTSTVVSPRPSESSSATSPALSRA